MGRAFWIMDDVTPLRGVARGLATAPMRSQAVGPAAGEAARGAAPRFSTSLAEYLFVPRDAYRLRYVAGPRRIDRPEYPPPGATIDYWLRDAPESVRIDILDSGGQPIRGFATLGPGSESRDAQESGSPRRGAETVARVPMRPGINRFVWDLQARRCGARLGQGGWRRARLSFRPSTR